ncbi:MAG TPA: NifB/NifX family molybdenum-iron cluster-binding protein [Phycisphaerae bacterium]|nr:NifB/NifX family molybdenum-iron cluster-binding protein [Phycisphaerae bacterium]
MKIGVSAMGDSCDAAVSPQFARCPYFVIVDSETRGCEAFSNSAEQASHGAGPMAVRELADRDVSVALAGKIGPNAEQALAAAKIEFVQGEGKISVAIENYLRGATST